MQVECYLWWVHGYGICHLTNSICPAVEVDLMGVLKALLNVYHTIRPLMFCKTHAVIHWHKSIGGVAMMLALMKQQIVCRNVERPICLFGMFIYLRWQFCDNNIAGGFDEWLWKPNRNGVWRLLFHRDELFCRLKARQDISYIIVRVHSSHMRTHTHTHTHTHTRLYMYYGGLLESLVDALEP